MDSKVINHAVRYLKKNYSNTMDELGEGPKQIEPLTIDDINQLHHEMVSYLGGSTAIRDQGLLESVVNNPFGTCFGVELYPTVFDKAAKYLLDFSRYQIYVDGNKRMGLATAGTFLFNQGYILTLTEEKACNLVFDIATHKIDDVKEIASILRDNYRFITAEDMMELEELEDKDDIQY